VEQYKKAKYERKASGYILMDDHEVASTLQCCHCNCHFVSVRGSGVIRGFCLRCMRVTCGASKCNTCRPFELQLGLYESGKQKVLG
jgi:hypothetical protein